MHLLNINTRILIYTSANKVKGGYGFTPVLSVCLLSGCLKGYGCISIKLLWVGGSWAKEKHINLGEDPDPNADPGTFLL